MLHPSKHAAPRGRLRPLFKTNARYLGPSQDALAPGAFVSKLHRFSALIPHFTPCYLRVTVICSNQCSPTHDLAPTLNTASATVSIGVGVFYVVQPSNVHS